MNRKTLPSLKLTVKASRLNDMELDVTQKMSELKDPRVRFPLQFNLHTSQLLSCLQPVVASEVLPLRRWGGGKQLPRAQRCWGGRRATTGWAAFQRGEVLPYPLMATK